VSTRCTGQKGRFNSNAPGIRQTGDNDAYIVLVTSVLKMTPSPNNSHIARRYEMGVFNTRRAPPTTSRIQLAMMPTCSRKTSRISSNEFDEGFLDNVGLASDPAVEILFVAAFVLDRFTGLPSCAACLAALLLASFSADRVRLALLLDESAQDASKDGITNSGSGDRLLALVGLLGVGIGGEGSSSSNFGEYSGLSGSSSSPSTTQESPKRNLCFPGGISMAERALQVSC
jgi:hypothetical protein